MSITQYNDAEQATRQKIKERAQVEDQKTMPNIENRSVLTKTELEPATSKAEAGKLQNRIYKAWKKSPSRFLAATLLPLVIIGGLYGASSQILGRFAVNVTVTPAQQANINDTVSGAGFTTPIDSFSLSFPTRDIVTGVNVKVGDKVNLNQTLLTMDPQVLQDELALASARVSTAQQTLNAVNQLPNASPTQKAAAQNKLQIAQLYYQSIQHQMNNTSPAGAAIISPFNGTVIAVNVTAGQLAPANKPLIQVADMSSMYAQADFPLSDAPILKPGDGASVTVVDAQGADIQGTVAMVSPQANSDLATVRAWIQFDNTDGSILSNMAAQVHVQVQRSGVTVPSIAVMNPEGDATVFVVSNGVSHLQHVAVGIQTTKDIEIVSGLQPGQDVVISGQAWLFDGHKVNSHVEN